MTPQHSIAPTEYWKVHEADQTVVLIDVSEPQDFSHLHAAGSYPVSPQETIELAKQARVAHKDLYLISRMGFVVQMLGAEMRNDGFENVVTIEGGTDAWVASGLPVLRDRGVAHRMIGILEAMIVVGGIVIGIVYPEPIMIAVLGAAGFIAVALVMWDDHLESSAVRLPEPRSHSGADRCSIVN